MDSLGPAGAPKQPLDLLRMRQERDKLTDEKSKLATELTRV